MDNTVVQALIMGIVQGLTEFLPISSSGHLIVIPALLGWTDPFIESLASAVLSFKYWVKLWAVLAVAGLAASLLEVDLDEEGG